MPPMTRLPPKIAYFLPGTQQFFRFRHQLIFCWTLVLILVYQDKATLKGLSRLGPRHLCEWHLRRFLCAHYWCWRMVLSWMVEAVLSVLPPPEDGLLLVVGDGTYRCRVSLEGDPQTDPRERVFLRDELGPYLEV